MRFIGLVVCSRNGRLNTAGKGWQILAPIGDIDITR